MLEAVLRVLFMGMVLGVMKFWQHRKKWEVDFTSRLQEHSGIIVT